jgi:hypothetical protein
MSCTRGTAWLLWGLLAGCAGDEGNDGKDGKDGGGDLGEETTGDTETDETDDTEPDQPSEVECFAPDPCDAASEYCLESYVNSVQMAGTCAPLPEACHACDCVLEQDIDAVWRDLNDGSSNCDGAVVYCQQDDAAIWVTCNKSGF